MKRLLRAAALFLVALLCILPMTAAGHATLYVGDSAYHGDSLSPFIESDGKQLVPLAAFGEFDALTLTVSESLGSFLLEGADNVWLSVSLNRGESLDETGKCIGSRSTAITGSCMSSRRRSAKNSGSPLRRSMPPTATCVHA